MQDSIESYIQLLGFNGKDRVTGFAGVISSVGFDLYGCVQVVLTPRCNDKGETVDGRWFDVARVEKAGTNRVMPVPSFVATKEKGPADKPLPR